jgi:DNA-directed RNA polymerase subunit H (RpoH/RPB5)
MTEKYKTALIEHLKSLDEFVKCPDRKSNSGALLGEIFTWQEVESYADAELRKAWKNAVMEGLIPNDDTLREKYDLDEHIVTESNAFSCLVTLGTPRKTLDAEALVDKLVKTFKLDRGKVVKVVESSKKEGKASLSKRIREV